MVFTFLFAPFFFDLRFFVFVLAAHCCVLFTTISVCCEGGLRHIPKLCVSTVLLEKPSFSQCTYLVFTLLSDPFFLLCKPTVGALIFNVFFLFPLFYSCYVSCCVVHGRQSFLGDFVATDKRGTRNFNSFEKFSVGMESFHVRDAHRGEDDHALSYFNHINKTSTCSILLLS